MLLLLVLNSDLLTNEEALENVGTFVIVVIVIFDKTPAVDVNNITLLAHAQQIETTDALAEAISNSRGHASFFLVQAGDIADLLAVGITLDHTINDRRLSGLGMAVIKTDSVSLDIFGVFHLKELLVDVAASRLRDGSGYRQCLVLFRTLIVDLAEQSSTTSTLALRIVDVDVVVLSVSRLLHEGLGQSLSVD